MKAFKYRNTLIAIMTLAFLLPGFAQETDVKKEIDSMSLRMFKNMVDRDYDAIIDMTHPKVFEIVPKETMVTVFKSMIEGNEQFSIELPNEIPEYKISEVFRDEDGDTDYAFVSYDMKMSMTFIGEEFDEERKEMMKNMMKAQGMDAEFVSNNTVNLEMPNRMTILVNDESTNNNWAMVNYDPDSPMFFQLLSAPVLEKAKDYYQNLMIASKKKE